MLANEKRRLGIDATFNINMASPYDYDAPVWATCDLVEELDVDEAWNTASGNSRGMPIEASAKTRGQCSATGRILTRDTDPVYQKLLAAFRSRDAEVDVMILSGPIDSDGATGPRGKFQVHRFKPTLGPNDVIYREFTLLPAIVTDAEPFVTATVVGGVLTYEQQFLPTDP